MTVCWLVGTHTLGLRKQQTLGFLTCSGRESIASHGDQERRVSTVTSGGRAKHDAKSGDGRARHMVFSSRDGDQQQFSP